MPLFSVKLNKIADDELALAGTVWLHTAAPTDASPANGRTTVGGGDYEAGQAVTAANWTVAANGDVNISIDLGFGVADEAVGTVGWWSFVTPSENVGYGTLPSRAIGDGDTYKINAGTIQFNGSST